MRLKGLSKIICSAILSIIIIIISSNINTNNSVLKLNITTNAAESQYTSELFSDVQLITENNNTRWYEEILTSGFWSYKKYKDGTAGICGYAGLDENIQIPSEIDGMKVVKICDEAFYKNSHIKQVSIPSTVSCIGYLAFAGSGLISITVPDTVTSWGESGWVYLPSGVNVGYMNGAFAECKDLEKVIINTESVPKQIFEGCINLKNVTLGEKTKYIEYNAFANDISLDSFKVNSDLYTVGDKAFYNCKNMQNIFLGNKLQHIGYLAFAGSGLEEIVIPDTVTSWGESGWDYLPTGTKVGYINGAFAQCENLEKVVINSEKLPKWLFTGCAKLNHVILGEKTKYIEDEVFRDDISINIFKVNSNLYTIGNKAFFRCKNMKNIYLGNKLQYIGYMAFAGSGLTDITIPDTVTSWGESGWDYLPSGTEVGYINGAFAQCDNLKDVKVGYIEMPKSIFDGSMNVNIYCVKDTFAYNYAITNNCIYTLYSPIPAISVKLSENTYTVVKGETLTLYPIMEPANSTDMVTWTSGNENIAVIDENNVVTAKSAGLVAVKCTVASGKSCTFAINVVDSGTTTLDKEPIKDISLSKLENITDKIYTGIAAEQELKVMFHPYRELIPDVDYTVLYKNNTNIGTATVIITGKGYYTGTISKTYKIEPASGTDYKPAPSEITETKDEIYTDRITINWKEVSNATGYNIYVNNQKINDKPAINNTYTIKGLQKNTTYNISITAVNNAGESEKSEVISVKTGNIVLGDINKDGKINIVDAMKVFHYVSGRSKNIDSSLADINEDGKVNIVDAMKVFHYVSGRNKEM